jgi:aryl-alcohol dehydrogenase-like predicted oxidoreductase
MPVLRKLGPWSVFPIGLGCMNVSWPRGAAVDPQSRQDSATPGIHAGLDAGVTLLDTADIYAPAWNQVGHNETFVAEALSSWQGEPAQKSAVLIATKGGITRSDGEKWGRDASLEYLVGAAERSRDRLGVDVIDLWQHHRLDPSIPFETQFENVLELKSRRIVKEIGVSFQIGIIVGIGVLIDTLLVRTVVVPALAFITGDAFWWPRKKLTAGKFA